MNIADHLRPWYAWPVCVIDFETTGPDPQECWPVEVAAVRFERGEPVARWSTLLKPGIQIPEEATAIHGITDADVADAPSAYELASVLEVQAWELLIGAIPCGYNAENFDKWLLHRHATGMRFHEGTPVAVYNWPWLDPLVVIRHIDRYVPGKGRHKLSTTCERHGIPMPTTHRALADAEATGRLLFSEKVRHTLGDATISEVLRRQALQAARQEAAFKDWQAKNPKPEPAT